MKISYARYRRAFASPFTYGDKTLTEREGFVLRVESPAGEIFSEAAPLPGHSRENAARVEAELAQLGHEAAIEAILSEPPVLSPSLTFALEGVQAQIFVLAGEGKHGVESNALVPWTGTESTLAGIEKKKAAGYKTVKLKVSAVAAPELLGLIGALKNSVKLRLDANRAWSEENLATFFAGLESGGAESIDYFEEPLAQWRSPLLRRSPVALAADECAADPRFWRALTANEGAPSVFVLKPTVSGGLFSLADKAKALTNEGKRVVYTSAMEAEPGRRAIISFLAVMGSAEAAGLATGSLFAENFLPDAPEFPRVPPVSEKEKAWLRTLAWRDLAP